MGGRLRDGHDHAREVRLRDVRLREVRLRDSLSCER